jgi:BirA family biotin operon repressor/biotin-[acetyl-CoA-carboxylase] ligase
LTLLFFMSDHFFLQPPGLISRLEFCDSTMNVARKLSAELESAVDSAPERKARENNSALIVAREQSSGRGRMGREWSSRKDQGLYLTALFLRPQPLAKYLQLPLVVGYELIKNLRAYGAEVQLKWPNDIYARKPNSVSSNYRKLAGILLESWSHQEPAKGVWLSIGIGLNIEQNLDSEVAISLQELVERVPARELLLANIWNAINLSLDKLLRDGFERYHGEMTREVLDFFNRCNDDVTVETKNGEKSVDVVGLAKDGALLVSDRAGDKMGIVQSYYSGDIRFRITS